MRPPSDFPSSNFKFDKKKHLGPAIGLAIGVFFIGALVLNAPACSESEQAAPLPPPPCKDAKLSAFGTETCPHEDHILETHVLKATVCRCKGNIKEDEGWKLPSILSED